MLAKPDHPPFTIEALAKWLRKQNPDQGYQWHDPVFCLMGKYLMDHDSCWGATSYSEMPGYEEIAAEKPWTFGAALERAEKLLALPAPKDEPLPEIIVPEQELVALPAPDASPKEAPNQL